MLGRAVVSKQERAEYTSLWGTSAECEVGGCVAADSDHLRAAGQEVQHPVT